MGISEQNEPDWELLRERILQTWDKLSDDDVEMNEGDTDGLITAIEDLYGTSREEILAELNTLREEIVRGQG